MQNVLRLLLLGCAGIVLGCLTTSPETVQLPGTESYCREGDRLQDGPYIYENNQWGKSRARRPFRQCLLRRTVGSGFEFGWTWDWPGYHPAVFAYPEIIYGWKPWSGGPSTDPRLPVRVADLHALTMSFEVDQQATGAYNLAPEIWLIKAAPATAAPEPTLITTEVMFWMDARNMLPAGRIIDAATFDGVHYKLWRLPSMGDKGNKEGWAFYAFTSEKKQLNATLDLAGFLRFLADKGYIQADEYVASIEFGSEVAGGRGTVWIRSYAITVESAP